MASLWANLVLRIFLAVVTTILSLVPLRLASQNGELAPAALIITIGIINLFTALNSAIWRTDDYTGWWNGAGLCDLEVYLQAPLYTAYAASIFAISRRVAQQVKIAHIAQPSREERARAARVQAATIFLIPLAQLAFTFFDISQRYKIGTLVGCLPVYDVSWPRVVLYEAPNPFFVLFTIPYAILAWKRYRAIKKEVGDVLGSNAVASARARQARCRLYYLSLTILVVYLPVSLFYLALTIRGAASAAFKPYDYSRIHHGDNPYPWDAILFVPSWLLGSPVINQPWIPISTNVFIIGFFGSTTHGLEMYRKWAVALGLARLWPRLRRSLINDATHDQIELDDLGTRDRRNGKAVTTRRARRSNLYPALDTGTSESFGPEPLLQTPARPLPPTPGSLQTPPPLPLGLGQSSPLESSRIIAPIIPERLSSLNQQSKNRKRSKTALRGPTNQLPQIREFPAPRVVAARRNIATPSVVGSRSHVRSNADTNPSRTQTSPPALPAAEADQYSDIYDVSNDNSSPRTLDGDSVLYKTSRDAVRPRSMIDDNEDWGGQQQGEVPNWVAVEEPSTSALPAPVPAREAPNWVREGEPSSTALPAPAHVPAHEVSWPFLRGTPSPPVAQARGSGSESEAEATAIVDIKGKGKATSGTQPTTSITEAGPSGSGSRSGANAVAVAVADADSMGKDKAKQKQEDDEETAAENDEEDSFIRHRDDPLPPDPFDSPPTYLAPGLEAIRPYQGRRTRIPRTANVQFDLYIKPKDEGKDKKPEDPESN
ncbi:ssDNA-binding protein, mitochondrial [Hypoxylon texense]